MEEHYNQRDYNRNRYEQYYMKSNNYMGPNNYMEPKRNNGFGKGVLVGVCSTLAAMLVIGLAVTVVLVFVRADIGSRRTGILANGAEDSLDDEAQASLETLLDVDFISQLSSISAYLEDYYLYDVNNEDLKKGMLDGLVSALGDPYAEYYGEAELASFQDSTDGSYVGIGAAVTQELSTGIVRISRPYEGTPSAEAGLLPGDMLISVDDVEVTGMDLNRVVALIKGNEGTVVTLHIYREEENTYLDIPVKRRQVEIPTVASEMLENKIGYIKITGFEGVTAEQFKAAYEDLKRRGMERVIVDLRDNGGGLVDTVEDMLDYLLPEGVIFYAMDKDGTKSMVYSSDADAALDIPAVVLVNENTASAAEIFSGNIQEFGLGKVVGTTTYGKGVMQSLFYTNSEQTTAIKLTVADYYIHSDKNINGIGITPDVEIELDEEAARQVDLPKEQDNQLQKAIEVVLAE